MTTCGKRFPAWLAVIWLLPALALADLTATIDRTQVRLGDSLQLTLSSDGVTDPATADLSPLARDFEILQQSSRSSTQIVNGTTTREKALVIELVPRRAGELEIPALFAGGERTQPIPLQVSEATGGPASDEQVVFTASVDSDSVYVQQQVILTLTLQQGIALDDRSVTELKLDDAYVKALGQNSYQRSSGGRRWLVHEIRYAIFPEQSGTLTIPAQTFAGRARQGSRSLFDLDSGPRISRNSEAITLEVKPRPSSFPGSTWLPASSLEIEESWSREPDGLATGDSVTRTVTVTGEGLQGAQLPPLEFPDTQGLKYYPDKPSIEEAETDTGVIGLRTDSAALVPVRPGVYRIPEVRIPWWDTVEDRLRYAVLPGREISVDTAAGDSADSSPTEAPRAQAAPGENGRQPALTQGSNNRWAWISGVLALCWLLTAAALGRMVWQRRQREPEPAATAPAPREPAAWKQLQAACAAGRPGPAREALRRWLQTLPPPASSQTPLAFAASLQDSVLHGAVGDLDRALYGISGKPDAWDGNALLLAAASARQRYLKGSEAADAHRTASLPSLYPGG
ncbi:BatD family protein [Chromatocurvus halotolerans]|uniref:Oxygen tolerance protein BatD n=1 Tax=Chromatocurvus halotolerans TaxID=1132028 RepID=A0A4R2KZA6_9GAMM|nr:BatD family protein [Chromatocurvus halotolerans]TCO75618.1 oxygen tolerance protein BatD [Chromatocurvus halotolerans]